MAAAVVPRSAPTERLLRVGSEAIARGDWKLAIDSLQRILDDENGSALVPDARSEIDQPLVFCAAQDVAERILATMPQDGLRAYRILYDGQAKAAYLRGVQEHDRPALTALANRFLLSSWGDDAAVLAAAWALDAGHSGEALGLLDRVESRCHTIDTTTPIWRRSILRAVAMAQSGDTTGARALLGDLMTHMDPGQAAHHLRTTETWIFERGRSDRTEDGPTWILEGASWPTRGGGADRSGIMPAVLDPQLRYSQTYEFLTGPSRHVGFDGPAVGHSRYTRIPAMHPCVEGGRLFVKSDDAFVALDLETLSPIWSVPRGSDVEERLDQWGRARAASVFRGMLPPEPNNDPGIATDYVTAALSVYHGQVYSIERIGFARDLPAGEVDKSVRPSVPTIEPGVVGGTRLIAYRAETGAILWQCGRTADRADPLGRVEFLAPPILVAGLLWSPILDLSDSAGAGNELSMVALDPRSGQQIHRVMLCSLSRTSGFGRSALYPAAAEHTLYIPTGHGLLLAMDAEQGIVRWASQYESRQSSASNARRPRSSPGPGQWSCSPPVVCGSAVVLAPVDGRQVMAFDRNDGHRLWSIEAPIESEYILAGTADTVILGGEVVQAIDVSSGAVRWTTRIPPPTGRGALSGSRIYLPTLDGLVVLDSTTGDRCDRDGLCRPATLGEQVEPVAIVPRKPLGNLLSMAGRLISVDPSRVQTFLDSATYDDIRAEFESQPTDVALKLRLATMELQRGEPKEARAILRLLGPGLAVTSDAQRAYAQHLGVRVLLELAGPAETLEAIEFLSEASLAARSTPDRIDVARVLAWRWLEAGRSRNSHRCLVDCIWTTPMDELVKVGRGPETQRTHVADSPLWRRGRDILAHELREIESEIGKETLRQLTDEYADVVLDGRRDLTQPDRRDQGLATLEMFADIGGPGDVGQLALIALADDARKRHHMEAAEQYLWQSVERERSSATGGETPVATSGDSLAALADLYREQGPALESLAEYCRKLAIGETIVSVNVDEPAIVLNTKEAWSRRLARGVPRLVDIRSGSQGPLGAARPKPALPLITVADGDVLRAHAIDDGALLWESELTLLDAMIDLPLAGRSTARRRWAARDGQTLIVNSSRGLHAVGAFTGKRLWSVEYEGRSDATWPLRRDQCLDAASGYVACERRAGLITVLRTLDGRVAWERSFFGRRAGRIRIHDRWVMVTGERAEMVGLYELATGRLVAAMSFDQADANRGVVWPLLVQLVEGDSLIVGPDGTRVVAYRVTDGIEAQKQWDVEMDDGLSVLVDLGDGHLLCGLHRSSVRMIEVQSGAPAGAEVYLDTPVPIGAAVAAGNVVVLAANERRHAGVTTFLYWMDRDTSEIVWSRRLPTVTPVGAEQLRVFAHAVPVLLRLESGRTRLRGSGRRTEVALVLIGKEDAREVGAPVSFSYTDPSDAPDGVMTARPGRLIFTTSREIVAVRTVEAQ
ncbi:MAG: PQQ-binding-like beta-propeller repeat protein [Planctomycetes bacterium]|nr:PQQ-binding-like beta-propeller repeat protein [Planctomycetota bacterium]